MLPNSCSSQVAIITGASEGIGKEIALCLALAGYKVTIVSRNELKLKKTLNLLGKTSGCASYFKGDMTSASQVKEMVKTIYSREGRIDILVNNLGQGFPRELVDTTEKDWEYLVGINLSSVFYACRSILPIMRNQKRGWIINIASKAGRCGEGNFAAYCAVKHGVIGLTRALADSEGKYGIKVNAVCPGPVTTERMLKKYPNADRTGWSTPQDVAEAVRFLLSPAAVCMNGQCLDLF